VSKIGAEAGWTEHARHTTNRIQRRPYELIATGELRTVKIGRRRFVTIEAIDEFIASLSA
jgi:hypothetical protein